MKIVLFGATGHIGQSILTEALQRDHAVTAVVRDPARVTGRAASWLNLLEIDDLSVHEPLADPL